MAYKKSGNLVRLAVKALICAAAAILVIGAYLFLAGRFSGTSYSNWLFIGAMVYIGLGGLSSFGSMMSVNNISYKYQSTVMNSNYEERKRIDDTMLRQSGSFATAMLIAGVLLLIASGLAEQLF